MTSEQKAELERIADRLKDIAVSRMTSPMDENELLAMGWKLRQIARYETGEG